MQFSAVAAVIAILSIQDTRKKSLELVKKRIIACTVSILLSFVIYNYIGQTLLPSEYF